MAKRVDPLKAKQAKQRKIAIGLAVAFVLVLAYQGPKTLKMLKGPQPPAAAEAVETPAATPTPTTTTSAGAPAVPATTPAGAGSQPAVLANSDVPVSAGEGQLLSFERFASKDPFQQQVDPDAPADAAGTGGGDPAAPDSSKPAADAAAPDTGSGSAENPPSPAGGMDGGSGSSGDSSVPAATPAASTTISVNGTVETVVAGTPFPADQPTFELISLAKDGKSVQIGVAGGSLAGGEATVKLVVGKPLTLQNTADGSRYKLELLTVQGAVTLASKG